MVGERSQPQKTTGCVIPFTVYIISRSIETERKFMVARGWEKRRVGVTANRYKVLLVW